MSSDSEIFSLAESAEKDKDYKKAEEYYLKILEKDPQNPDVNYKLAETYHNLANYNVAMSYAIKSMKDNKSVKSIDILGSCLLEVGDVEKAIMCCKQSIEIDSECYRSYYVLGRALALLGNYMESESNLLVAQRLAPDNKAVVESLRGLYQNNLKNYSKAAILTDKLKEMAFEK